MREVVIVSAVRIPTGKFLGTLKDFAAPQLGAMVVREAVRRAGVDYDQLDRLAGAALHHLSRRDHAGCIGSSLRAPRTHRRDGTIEILSIRVWPHGPQPGRAVPSGVL